MTIFRHLHVYFPSISAMVEGFELIHSRLTPFIMSVAFTVDLNRLSSKLSLVLNSGQYIMLILGCQ